jgi:plastocyanin domain-containing protein
MTTVDWIVVLGGIAAIAWVNWYFFFAERSVATVRGARVLDASEGGATATTSTPEVQIAVRGGYDPGTIRVPVGRPVRLVFERQDTSSCSEEIVLPDFGIRRFLPTGKKVTIEVTPTKAGRYEFHCGMAMLHGALIAEDGGDDHA